MKTFKILAVTTTAALLVGGLVLYTARAQDQARAGFGHGHFLQRIIKGLNLTQEQLGKIKAELRAEKDTAGPLLKRFLETRKELRETINKPGVTETEVRAAAAKAGAAEADLAVERARISGKIRPILTDEQIQKIKDFQGRADQTIGRVLQRIGQHLDTP